jgi:hypothetical protein
VPTSKPAFTVPRGLALPSKSNPILISLTIFFIFLSLSTSLTFLIRLSISFENLKSLISGKALNSTDGLISIFISPEE